MNRSWMSYAAIAVFSLCLNVHGGVDQKDAPGKEWPGHNPEFSGPGDPDKIAAAALEFLRKKPDWSKPEYDDVHTPYAACVTGSDWSVSKKAPLTHQPTQFSINVLVAFTGEKDPDIAYVYHMVFYTKEEAGVEKAPPFRYANSRQYAKYQMDLDQIPTGGGGSFLWRLLLGLALIAGGLVAAEKSLAAKVPPLKKVSSILGSLALPIGGVLALLGLGGFLSNLVRLSPHASVLPQLAAIGLGIVLVRTALKPKAPEPAASDDPDEKETAEPRNSQPTGILSKFAFLDALQTPLGLVALVLGVLHLVIGGFALV